MPSAVMFEREAELRSIVAAFERAAAGEGGLVVVEGPAGIGKTHLVRAAQAAALERGALVLSARGGELEHDFAHGVVRELFERHLVLATPEARAAALSGPAATAAAQLGLDPDAAGAPSVAADASAALLHGLFWLVANLAAAQPLLLAVDDVQWADAPSLRFLHYLARRLDGLPALIVATRRAGEEGSDPELLARLLGDPAAQVVSPRPLTVQGARDLLTALLGEHADEGFAAACHAATGGNPFLLRQLADALRADGLDPAGVSAERIGQLGPRSVARSILLRLGRQSEAAAALARGLAVLGPAAPLRVVAALVELDHQTAARAAEELTRIDLLDASADPSFVHPIVRRAIYSDIARTERSRLHASAARVLMDEGAEARSVAPHLLSAEPAGDERVVAMLREAAGAAVREGAPAIAVRFLERALEEPPPPDRRGAVLHDLGRAQLLAGDTGAAAATLRGSVRLAADPRERAERSLVLARALAACEGPAAAIAEVEEAITALGDGDRELTLRLEAELTGVAVLHDPTAQSAARRLERHRDLPGETRGECLLLATLARHATLQGGTAGDAAELAKRALRSGVLVREETAESIALHSGIFVLVLCDEAAGARATLDQAYVETQERGSVFGLGAVALTSSFAAFRAGDLMVAESEARAALAAMGRHASFWPTGVAVIVQALTERGELEAAHAELRDRDALGAVPEVLTASRLLVARAGLAVRQERFDDARADLEEVVTRERRWGLVDPEIGWRPVMAQLEWRTGDEEAAQRTAAEQLAIARRWGTETAVGAALRTVGLVGPLDDASLHALEEAVERLGRSPSRLELARATVDLGAALRRRGRRSDAQERLREGIELARECHALALVERAHEELIAAGARPRRLQFSGLESLTASERRVAELAASGLGNREVAQTLFVSMKTVENHLSRVYGKLGIHSRGELPQALRLPAPAAPGPDA